MPGSQMPVLTCSSTVTSLSDPRRSWVWQTWTRSMFPPGVSYARLANAPAPASRSGKQGGLVTRTSTSVSGGLSAPHREHHSSSRRNSDGPRFHIWHKGSSEFLFRASGRHPNVWILSVEALFLTGLTTQTDGLTVTQLHASRMLRTIWRLLHQVRCSTQSFRNRAHRWGKVVSFPLHSGENKTTPLWTLT